MTMTAAIAHKSEKRRVPIKDLKVGFYVRKQLNQDHVLMLAELYEAAFLDSKVSYKASETVQPIKITEEMVVVDGRHRKEAMELAGLDMITVEVVPKMTMKDMILEGMKSNMGGALPPTREDIQFTVEQMLTRLGTSYKDAIAQLSQFMPPSVARKYVGNASSHLNKIRLQMAVAAVSRGLTVGEAAEAHDVSEEALSELILGKQKKIKVGAAQVKASITHRYNSYATQTAMQMKKLFDNFRDGEIGEGMLIEAFNSFRHTITLQERLIANWEARLKAAKVGVFDAEDVEVKNGKG